MQWRILVSIQIPLVGILFVGAIFLPETPRWLVKNDRTEQAEKTLLWIRLLPPQYKYLQYEPGGTHTGLNEELRQMGSANVSRADYLRNLQEFIRPDMLRRISVGVITQLIGQLSGIKGISKSPPSCT